ncbi:DNA-binding transcription factor yap1 [Sporothrix epigloea]|uniref:DNA-binding transcription factor yap1 n=1 Tax=Sporothrix epigloea TaxID=1892477 RepID=A0ABP0DEN1_9PEZI
MAYNQNFFLTAQQQELLFAALNAHRPIAETASISPNTTLTDTLATTKPNALRDSIADSSFLDFDHSFDGADTSLDFSFDGGDQTNFFDLGDGNEDAEADDSKTDSAPSNADNDSPDKRSYPEDKDSEDGVTVKRHESTEKVPKKPGRKPITTDSSSKRKAQNRAAQRAFRERKEKHLKDLEDKVAELEKASETANSENDVLRAQVEKMTAELNDYKKRMDMMSRSRSSYLQGGSRQVFGNPVINNINDVNFQFKFPKFGQLPGPTPTPSASSTTKSTGSNHGTLPSLQRGPSHDALNTPSPVERTGSSISATMKTESPGDSINGLGKTTTADDLFKFSNVFTPPPPLSNTNNSRSSMDSGSTSSPSASSHTTTALSSSCGTSPESYKQSPTGFKPLDTMATIGEEHLAMFGNTNLNQGVSQFANTDFNDMSWLNGQENFQFNPQLFGNYREPQDNILASGGFDDSFFNDALEMDFTTPFNMAPSPIITTTSKSDSLIAQIDSAKEGEFASSSIAVQPQPKDGSMLTCNKIWERLQNCPKVQNGDFDLDGLCADLQKKAKCSGSGAVVDEKAFEFVMNKYLDKKCPKGTDNLLGDVKAPVA